MLMSWEAITMIPRDWGEVMMDGPLTYYRTLAMGLLPMVRHTRDTLYSLEGHRSTLSKKKQAERKKRNRMQDRSRKRNRN